MTFPYEDSVDPASVDMDARGLAKVAERFRRQQASGEFPGGQMVVRRHGKVALNVAVGLARGFRPAEAAPPVTVQPRTPFCLFSSGKPLAAIAIAMLEERGLLDVEAPVAKIIPEFAHNGKSDITTLDVLTHRAGVLVSGLYKNYRHSNRESVLNRVIEARPMYKRGTFAYMPTEFGVILSEIMRRTDGRTLAEFVSEEISTPLNLPGLRYGLADRAIDSVAHNYWLGKEKYMICGIDVAENFEKENNSAELFNSENPAFTMISDAASLAAFYEFLLNKGVTRSGKRLLSKEIIRRYTTLAVSGWNKSLGTFIASGRGFVVGTRTPSAFGWWNSGGCFGHGGMFSSLAFGDHTTGLAVAIVTNGNRGMSDSAKRLITLSGQLRKACFEKG